MTTALSRFFAYFPVVPKVAYLSLFQSYMDSESERARAQSRAAELQTENVRLRDQLKAAAIHQQHFQEVLEEILTHSEEMVSGGAA